MLCHPVQQQTKQTEPLVEFRIPGPVLDGLVRLARQDFVHLVVGAVLVEQVVVDCEILGDFPVLQILAHQILVNFQLVLLIQPHHVRQIRPAPGGDEPLAVHGGLHLVEVRLFDLQVGHHGGVGGPAVGVFLPGVEVGLHVHPLEPIPGDDVELPDGVVIFRRVARRHHDPALRDLVAAENLVLQKLEHGGGQGLGHAVDLVQEQNALLHPGVLHQVVDGGNDLAHGVLGHVVLLAAVGLADDEGQAQGALAGVVGHGVAHQPHPQLRRDLLHDGGLADARRAHQEHGPLLFNGDDVATELVLGKIRRHGVLDLRFSLFDVHNKTSLFTGPSA